MTADTRRLTAGAWMIGGGAWVANGLLGLDSVDGTGGFYVSEIAWLVVHALVLLGLVGLLHLTPPTDRLSRRGFTIALVGRAVFIVAEIFAIALADGEVPLLPLAAVLTAVGMIVGGAGVIRGRRWAGWARLAPLAMGVYPFVAMFPVVAVTGDRPDTSVSLWGVMIFLVGLAILDRRARVADESSLHRDLTSL